MSLDDVFDFDARRYAEEREAGEEPIPPTLPSSRSGGSLPPPTNATAEERLQKLIGLLKDFSDSLDEIKSDEALIVVGLLEILKIQIVTKKVNSNG